MQSLRLQRVCELLKRQIGEVIRRELPIEQAGMVTVNEVKVSSDLHAATVYVGIVGSDDQRKRGINLLHRHRKHIQGLVARAVILKYTPHLRFLVDESASKANRVLAIIDEIERTGESHEEPSQDH